MYLKSLPTVPINQIKLSVLINKCLINRKYKYQLSFQSWRQQAGDKPQSYELTAENPVQPLDFMSS